MRVAIVDYGAGNLHSLAKAVRLHGVEVVTTTPREGVSADVLVLPGVGAFASASEYLEEDRDMLRAALQGGMPCLGVCLGMQLLFDASEEGPGKGLGVISGQVRRLRAEKLPQIGWNDLEQPDGDLYQASQLHTAYFANSFVCEPEDESLCTAWATHGNDRFVASVESGRIVGAQFHPEKSSASGLAFIGAFLELARG